MTFTIGMRSRPHPLQWSDRRQASQTGRAGQPQRILFPARPRDGQEYRHQAVHRNRELGERARRERPAHSRSQKIPHHRWRARFAQFQRSHQLARAQLRSGNRAILRRHQPLLQHVLSHGYRRSSGRLGRTRQRRGQRRQRAARSRLQNRQHGRGVTTGPAETESSTI